MTDTPKEPQTHTSAFWRGATFLQFILPLSMRGLLILLALSYLILSPILNESDIIASMIAALLGGLCLIVLISSAIFGFRLRKNGQLEIHVPSKSRIGSEDKIIAQAEADFLIACTQITVPPLFRLKLSLQFLNEGIAPSFHIVAGRLDSSKPIIVPITFPHRGIWQLTGIQLVLEDCFGITRQAWVDLSASDLSAQVFPRTSTAPLLPIISSTYRAGDDINHHTQRLGEPFDIKPYHPADGIKRILWKVFAKRGELVARHPEHAVTPEGHVIAFIIARRKDDALAAWSLAYFREIEALNLTMEVGCLGMEKSTALARSSAELEQILITSAFLAPKTLSYEIIGSILETIQNRANQGFQENSASIALFFSESLLSSKETTSDLLRLIQVLGENGVTATICLRRDQITNLEDADSLGVVKRLFLQKEVSKAINTNLNTESRAIFLNTCALKNLTVLQEKGFSHGARSA
jgi:uncharacterized protein (DUF58 family)